MKQLVNSLYQFSLFFCPLQTCVSSEGRVEVVGGGSLQISNLTEEDGGVYTCTASNANTTIEAQAQLTVQGTFSTLSFFFLLMTDGKDWVTLLHANYGRQCSDKVFKSAFTPDGSILNLLDVSHVFIWHRAHKK